MFHSYSNFADQYFFESRYAVTFTKLLLFQDFEMTRSVDDTQSKIQ